MTPGKFFIVDVFAEEKFSGNQLAVCFKAGGFSGDLMQRIAREINFSETTFVLSEKLIDNAFDVRIFTPREEVPFAGHPTLGTAFCLQQQILQRPIDVVNLNLKVGRIPVTFHYQGGVPDILWMNQIPPVFGETLEPSLAAEILGLDISEIDGRFPIEQISTGLPFVIVPVTSLSSLERIQVNQALYFEVVEQLWAKAILAFCPEARSANNHLSTRVFAGYYGVPEDPATGSANGCLAGYLVKHRYFGCVSVKKRIEQGHKIGRSSLIHIQAEKTDGQVDISVGGRVVMVAEGNFI